MADRKELKLFRYTEFKYLEELLRRRSLRLGSPQRWHDKNDAYTVDLYRKRAGLGRVLALCVTSTQERSHHWTNFSTKESGVCIRFRGPALLAWAGRIDGMQCRRAIYRKIQRMESICPSQATLPFLKRYAYCDEQEYRLLYGDELTGPDEKWFPIDLDMIDLITVNPWLGEEKAAEAKLRIQKLLERLKSPIKVQRSLLLENRKWKSLAARTRRSAQGGARG